MTEWQMLDQVSKAVLAHKLIKRLLLHLISLDRIAFIIIFSEMEEIKQGHPTRNLGKALECSFLLFYIVL